MKIRKIKMELLRGWYYISCGVMFLSFPSSASGDSIVKHTIDPFHFEKGIYVISSDSIFERDEHDGLMFRILSEKEVEFADYRNDTIRFDRLVIPERVSIKDRQYDVVGIGEGCLSRNYHDLMLRAYNPDTVIWAHEVQERGAGEILFTSMDHDGVKQGFANEALAQLADNLSIPIIASGGAGQMHHFRDAFTIGHADAALAASVFHFGEIPIPKLKKYLRQENISIRI